ncbi:ADYC domain-containing protein [Pelagibius sp.]|uniref:ADYC domain-containing protein n=1 Tax=Pelagibius sp. TaxID=1931238 RepID=UPI0026187640|nr:ADYC domain-containing protein [Pelagibius sp.]
MFGTELRLTQADGSVLAGAELAGRTLSFDLPGGQAVRLRIDTVIRDPQDPRGEILLYRFLREDPADGVWRPLCPPAPDGLPVGFALRGAWDAGGRYRSGADDITLVCASGAIGKCLRMGYRLWGEAADGTPLHLFHQACTRAMRADYCGDGTSHTRDGTPIRIGDRLGLLDAAEAPDAVFEGLWGPDGALCLARPRLADAESLEDLVAACPRLEGRIGQACRAAQFAETPAALLLSYGAADPMR